MSNLRKILDKYAKISQSRLKMSTATVAQTWTIIHAQEFRKYLRNLNGRNNFKINAYCYGIGPFV